MARRRTPLTPASAPHIWSVFPRCCKADNGRQLLAALRRCQRHRINVAQLFCIAFPVCSMLVLLLERTIDKSRSRTAPRSCKTSIDEDRIDAFSPATSAPRAALRQRWLAGSDRGSVAEFNKTKVSLAPPFCCVSDKLGEALRTAVLRIA